MDHPFFTLWGLKCGIFLVAVIFFFLHQAISFSILSSDGCLLDSESKDSDEKMLSLHEGAFCIHSLAFINDHHDIKD